MKKFILIFLAVVQTVAFADKKPEIFYHNRILAKVKGKTISLMDVVKQMNIYLYSMNPDALDSTEARLQMYSQSWQYFLDQLINNELMLVEAKERKIETSEGDIREEVIERFGPNVQQTLAKLNITLEEAKDYVLSSIVSRKIEGFFVHSKAFQQVTPEKVRKAYEQYLVKNPGHTKWKYQFLTVRSKEEALTEKVAQRTRNIISEQKTTLSKAAELAKQEFEDVKITVSQPIEATDGDISDMHKKALITLPLDAISQPLMQVARSNEKVYRLFHVLEKEEVPPADFKNVYGDLKDALVRQISNVEQRNFVEKLREKYDISLTLSTTDLPADYKPFEVH